MSLHLTNKLHEIIYNPVFTLLKKRYMRFRNLFCHHG